MRVYIIGNDGITLCREPPAAVSEGEIVVASNEELHAARLSGKRLLALWNALPDVEKRKKVRDRAVDVGEDRRGAGPEAVEQGALLVGQHEALRHQRVAAADQGTQ